MSDNALAVSVVVPSCDRRLALLRCLLALQEQEPPPLEVLVAHRDDDPDTATLVAAWPESECRVRAINAGQANASTARNVCLAAAAGDIVAFVDDDVVVRPGWVAALRRAFREYPAVGGVGGPDWIDGDDTPATPMPRRTGAVQWFGRRIGNHHRGAPSPRVVTWLKGANMAFRRDAIAGLRFGMGLRGDAAQFAEDVQLSLQVRRRGWQLRYDPCVAVDHYPGPMADGHDHRTLGDDRSLHDAAHNETVALLGFLSWPRRLAFMAWSFGVGTRLLPGLAAAVMTRGTRNDHLHRMMTVWRARQEGWRSWRQLQRAGSETALPADPRGALRICLVTHVVRPNDGQGRVNYELARWLAARSHQVTLVASDVDPALARLPGIDWRRVAVPVRAPAPIQWACFAWGARRAIGKDPESRFDVVHVNGAIAPVRALVNTSHFVHRAWQRIMTTSSSDGSALAYQQLVTSGCAWLERRAYRSARQVVAVSESVRESLGAMEAELAAPVAVIHTGVDLDEFRPAAARDESPLRGRGTIPADRFLALFVGDLRTRRKNLDLALRVVAHSGARVHLVVVGETTGSGYPARAAAMGIADRVHFTGVRDDVAACYRDADVVFCAAHYEPASLVLLEAMATGVPVITTPQVGNAVFVDDCANGFLLRSADDLERAVEIVEYLCVDPRRGRAIGHAARSAVADLTWARMAERYETLYRGTLRTLSVTPT
ncbi:MAG TPA: glycosyltransferase [Gemmatimonadales bacterium]|jgi:glycosyltransferase involved in cell wall biosynthesis/GT2 family glycosyltransferase